MAQKNEKNTAQSFAACKAASAADSTGRRKSEKSGKGSPENTRSGCSLHKRPSWIYGTEFNGREKRNKRRKKAGAQGTIASESPSSSRRLASAESSCRACCATARRPVQLQLQFSISWRQAGIGLADARPHSSEQAEAWLRSNGARPQAGQRTPLCSAPSRAGRKPPSSAVCRPRHRTLTEPCSRRERSRRSTP